MKDETWHTLRLLSKLNFRMQRPRALCTGFTDLPQVKWKVAITVQAIGFLKSVRFKM